LRVREKTPGNANYVTIELANIMQRGINIIVQSAYEEIVRLK